MDINLPGKDGIKTVAEIKPLKPQVQYLMCTSYEEPEKTFESLCAGATGYLVKNCTPEKLFDAVKEIYNGGSPMSPQIARLGRYIFQSKTKNQCRNMNAYCAGKRNFAIAFKRISV